MNPVVRSNTVVGTGSNPVVRSNTVVGTSSNPVVRSNTVVGTSSNPVVRSNTVVGTNPVVEPPPKPGYLFAWNEKPGLVLPGLEPAILGSQTHELPSELEVCPSTPEKKNLSLFVPNALILPGGQRA